MGGLWKGTEEHGGVMSGYGRALARTAGFESIVKVGKKAMQV